VKNGTAKIADLGLAKQEEDIMGTVTGTPTKMAPEVLKGKVYGTQADIYSVGIILWEMWYARPGYTHPKTDEPGNNVPIAETPSHLSQLIITGTRPDFENKYKPHHSLQSLMKHCWDSIIIKRPTAENVVDKLKNMQLLISSP
jgi:receptor-interacting serine/threonine-protein kinase 5